MLISPPPERGGGEGSVAECARHATVCQERDFCVFPWEPKVAAIYRVNVEVLAGWPLPEEPRTLTLTEGAKH